MNGSGRGALLLVAATVVLGAARYAPIIDEPFQSDPASGNGAWYDGQPVRNWQRMGFGTLRGIPFLQALPTTPPVGLPYAHHPPTVPWLANLAVSAVGLSERGMRIVPIVFSSIAGGILVWLVASRLGRGAAALAAVLWLVLPMSFLFGWMCNPEAPGVCTIVLATSLHVALRTGPWSRYAAALAAQFLAGLMDWEGQFAIPAVLLYELMRGPPKGPIRGTPRMGKVDRRLGRVAALAVASLASAAVTFVIHGYFHEVADRFPELLNAGARELPPFSFASIPNYLVLGFRSAAEVGTVSAVGSDAARSAGWIGSQLTHLELFTWPAVAATAAGVVLAIFKRTESRALGLALLVPGILNVAIFRRHAVGHQYWLYYLTPGVVYLTAEVARAIRSRVVVAVVTVAIVALSCVAIVRERAVGRTTPYKELAAELDGLLEHPDDVLICDTRFSVATFYTRHWSVAEGPALPAWSRVDNVVSLKKIGRLRSPVVFLLLPLGESPPLERLAASGRLVQLSPTEVATKLPTIAKVYDRELWLLRID